jgi:NAD(P)-dependent dehydrogenase (short-subunit alcohol dehydrogenase family)
MTKSIFITGAASGMGLATAEYFAEKGWFIGAFDVNADGLENLRAKIGNGIFRTLDVTNASDYAAAVEEFGAATGGTLDLMFNNAGIGTAGLLDEQPIEDIERVLQVNLMGVIYGVRAGVPLLKKTPGSLCLITSSSSAIFGTAGIAIYSATKHAVRGLTEALSIELKRFGVRASDLLPGLIDTPMLGDQMRQMAPPEGMWRLVNPREIAETVWRAYHEDQLHWYIPEELRDFHRQVVDTPEAVREERTQLLASMTPID